RGQDFKGKRVLVSGSGNVAQYACEKVNELGGKVLTLSDSNGSIVDEDGIDNDKLAFVMHLKNDLRGRIKDYVKQYPKAKFLDGQRPWSVPCDIALPCATENEVNGDEAKTLLANGCICVAEGANMPSNPDAIEHYLNAKILYGLGKAANAGGVAVSGLEMSQNSMRLGWGRAEVDSRLHEIMRNIHAACVKYGKEDDGYVNYVKGANIAGFIKVADSMLDQGLV
ncbi:MAG: glutamate dehydrogenase, partial [Deltaproteobacteria bacterium]|nr:glutamate dehydrogenase [Deltaproteobacteria bacterium]